MAESPTDHRGPAEPASGAWYVVILLAISNAVSFFDRGFISLVVDPIKHTLTLTDTQMGLILGPAFIIFYSVISLPIAHLSDSRNRKNIILAGLLLWTLATGLFGIAGSFLLLFAARMAVGLGEAALVPAGISIIGDIFPRRQMGRAVSTLTAGGIMGAGLASLAGGYLVQWLQKFGKLHVPFIGVLEPWQSAFVIISIPGLVLGLIMMLTLREPVRQQEREASIQSIRMSDLLRHAARHKRAMLCLIAGFAMISTLSGVAPWTPAFYMRTFHFSIAQVGLFIGVTSLCMGVTGALIGGRIADFLRGRGREDANIIVALVSLTAMIPLSIGAFLVDLPWLSIVLMAVRQIFLSMCYGVAHPCVSMSVPSRLRSKAVALYLLCANGVGIGIVPLAVPLLTDYIFKNPLDLRYSLLAVCVTCAPIAIALLLIARKPFVVAATSAVGAAELMPEGEIPEGAIPQR